MRWLGLAKFNKVKPVIISFVSSVSNLLKVGSKMPLRQLVHHSAIRLLITAWFAFMFVVAATQVQAHPGHGITGEGDSAAHYFVEPTHGLGIALGIVASAAILWMLSRSAVRSE